MHRNTFPAPHRPHRGLPMRGRLIVLLLVLLLLSLSTSALVAWSDATPPATDAHGQTVQVVRIRAATPDDAARLATLGLDLLHLREGPDLFALMTDAELADLRARGWQAQPDPQQTALLRRAASLQTFASGYRSEAEIAQALQAAAAAYPELTTLIDYGDSWQRTQAPDTSAGHDLWALRITSPVISRPKPVFFLLAAIHPRELVTPEVALRFIDYVLGAYGTDADVTWLLNEHEVVVVPLANPDGYRLVEQELFQRKNLNDSANGQCADPPRVTNQAGVDLNRNFAFRWGTINTPSTNPCSQVFPGTAAASEPETVALQALVEDLFPGRSAPTAEQPAPADASGVLISMHSYANMILWPWGGTAELAPNAAGLEQLGTRLADFTGYLPVQAVRLYPTSGTTDEWSYGTLGIASYTFEIGPQQGECGGFMPPFACMDGGSNGQFWQTNLPALLYAARVARAPYTQPAAPDIAAEDVRLLAQNTGTTTAAAVDVQVRLPVASDAAAVELYLDQSPWQGGEPVALESSPLISPTQDSALRTWRAQLPAEARVQICQGGTCTPTTPTTPTLVLLRAQNSAGDWGPVRAVWAQAEQSSRHWLPIIRP